MNNKDITIIETWDNKKFEIDVNIEKWLVTIDDLKSNGANKIFLDKYTETLYFSNIKSEKGKTLYIALPESKKEYKEPTEEERIAFKKFQEDFKVKTFETRKKNFRIKRDAILNDLKKEEKEFGLETILEKLTELDQRRLKEQKDLLKI